MQQPEHTTPVHATTGVANPYAAPASRIDTELPSGSEYPLAERGTRLLAAIVDAFIVGIPCFAIGYFTGLISFTSGQAPGLGTSLGLFAIYIVIWLAVNFSSLKFGQTIGKKVTKIQIVDYETGNIPSLTSLIGVRYFAIWVIILALNVMMPYVGSLFALVDVLMIFGKEQRCLHDIMAKTKVVKPQQK